MTILILFSLGTIWFNGLVKIGDCWPPLSNNRSLACISPDIRLDRLFQSCRSQFVKVIIEYFCFCNAQLCVSLYIFKSNLSLDVIFDLIILLFYTLVYIIYVCITTAQSLLEKKKLIFRVTKNGKSLSTIARVEDAFRFYKNLKSNHDDRYIYKYIKYTVVKDIVY